MRSRWLAPIDRGVQGTAVGEDPVDGDSRFWNELRETHEVEQLPDGAASAGEVNRMNLGDFGIGP